MIVSIFADAKRFGFRMHLHQLSTCLDTKCKINLGMQLHRYTNWPYNPRWQRIWRMHFDMELHLQRNLKNSPSWHDSLTRIWHLQLQHSKRLDVGLRFGLVVPPYRAVELLTRINTNTPD